MCEKETEVKELKVERDKLLLEMSEIRKNYSEAALNDVKRTYHAVAVVAVPIIIAFLAGAATVIAAMKF